jgi:hypothetical protein
MNPIRLISRSLRAAALLLIVGIAPTLAFAAAPSSFDGVLRIQVEDRADGARLHYFLEQSGTRLELRGLRPEQSVASGSRVRVRGARLGNVLALDESGTSNLTAIAPAELAYATGVQNVAVIMVNFSDNAVQPMTATAMQDAVFGTTSDFLRENSGGQTWLAGSVFGWYTLPVSKASCDPAQIATLADQAATSAGANLSAYTRKFYVFPKNACTWAGLADVGGASTRAWYNGKFDLDNFGHEFGHNLGLMHSHGLDCDTSALGDTCTPLSYGDAADIMGNLEGHYNAFQKERLGWATGATTVTASGRYTLAPYSGASGTRALRIQSGVDASGKPTWYYLEYRQPVGFDAVLGYYGTLAKGVLVRNATTGDGDSSYLLDMTPNSDTSSGFVDLWDSALMAGRTYTDAVAKLSVTVVSTTANGAVVDVVVQASTPPPPPTAGPLTETLATSKASYLRGETVGLGAQVFDAGKPVAGATVSFTITRPGGGTISLAATTGANGTASASYRLNKQKDPRGAYAVNAQAKLDTRTATASTSFQVQ